MFALAIGIGIYAYLVFALGIVGLLYKIPVALLSFGFILFLISLNKIYKPFKRLNFHFSNYEITLVFLLLLLFLVAFIGALSPETSFDALWYHLTLPKLYILSRTISHIPGGLLYYSDMPKLIEMLYIPALMFGNEVVAKLIEYAFGILTCAALYRLSRNYLERKNALLVILIFYSNIAVLWLSTVAYIDLGRTFFEVMAFLGFLNYIKTKNEKWLIESAIVFGLAISSKLIAIAGVIIFISLVLFQSNKTDKKVRKIIVFTGLSLLISSPWYATSYLATGNPVYPLFTHLYPSALHVTLKDGVSTFINGFLFNPDIISPTYFIFIPLFILSFRNLTKKFKPIVIYVLLATLIWYITPQTGGGRFIVPYLPIFSLLVVLIIANFKNLTIKRILLVYIILLSVVNLVFRFAAEWKYWPVFLGKESRSEYLTKHLNFKYGDFYDTDSFFAKTIKGSDKVLLYGFHNLYYVNFPFIDSSWVKKGDTFDYIATQNTQLPERFKYWDEIYENDTTGVRLYTLKTQWIY